MSNVQYEIRLLRLAEEDLTEIISYVAADRPSMAKKLLGRFNIKLSVLAISPHVGHLPNELSLNQLGYRYLVLDNYLIFYVIEGRMIYVHRIVHGARDYKNLL
ncbi:MAG: type II toxin-antitoxin system RelE/ParE family toxin [Patescibacteria group bacterium]|nr:type II toxin-antitoxin system RelE/ParE family toxin [Patescibacteria group bacterium]